LLSDSINASSRVSGLQLPSISLLLLHLIQPSFYIADMIASSFSALSRTAARQAARKASRSMAAPAVLSASAGASSLRMRFYSEQAAQAKTDSADNQASSNGNADEETAAAIKKMQDDFEKSEKELARMKVRL